MEVAVSISFLGLLILCFYLFKLVVSKQEIINRKEVEISRLYALERKYHDLLFRVESKVDGENRHQTAKRYIIEAEDRSDTEANSE